MNKKNSWKKNGEGRSQRIYETTIKHKSNDQVSAQVFEPLLQDSCSCEMWKEVKLFS